jgi:hypothetical protein
VKEIEIIKIFFKKINFELRKNEDSKLDGKIETQINILDDDDGSKTKKLIAGVEVEYSDNEYTLYANVIGVFGVDKSIDEEYLDDPEFQKLLINPILKKLSIYVGVLSEGIDGLVRIPDFPIDND